MNAYVTVSLMVGGWILALFFLFLWNAERKQRDTEGHYDDYMIRQCRETITWQQGRIIDLVNQLYATRMRLPEGDPERVVNRKA